MKLTMNASPVNGRMEYSYSEFLDILKSADFFLTVRNMT